MNTIRIKVPDFLFKQAQELANKEDVTLEQLISSALAEKMSALMTVDYLKTRASKGERHKFEQAMNKVTDVEPDEFDLLN